MEEDKKTGSGEHENSKDRRARGKGKNRGRGGKPPRGGRSGNSASRGSNGSSDKDFERSGSRNYGRGGSDSRSEGTSSDVIRGDNDLSWYTRYPALIAAAANVAFAKFPGSAVQVGPLEQRIPGVLALDYLPSIGLSTNDHSAPSQLATELYARVREAYSGELDADGPDMVVYIQAIANAYMYISWLKRIYRTLNSFSSVNYNTPNLLLRAYGLSSDTIQQLRIQKTEFWGYINQLISSLYTYKVPAVFDVMRRYVWLCDNVFMDTDDISEAQFYVFNPLGFYKFALQNTPDGIQASGLELDASPIDPSMSSGTVDARTLFAYGQSLITEIKSWSTAQTINGYFKRAFRDAEWFGMMLVPEGDLQVPIYSMEVLGQIENFRGIPTDADPILNDLSGMAVSQDPKTNAVLSKNQVYMPKATASWVPGSAVNMNIRGEQTPELVVIDSRMIAMVKSQDVVSDGKVGFTMECATELPIRIRYLDIAVADADTAVWCGANVPTVHQLSGGIGVTWFEYLLKISAFDWHPFCYLFTGTDDTGDPSGVSVVGDVHNFATIAARDMRRIHEICLYSEYNAFSLI